MPLFLKHHLLFIHIPKCGGDTIGWVMRKLGDPPFLFVDDGAIMVNGHTPQHMTWLELCMAGWVTPPGFDVAALARHPIDRAISSFRYIRHFRPDLRSMAPDPATFLDHFLSADPDIFRRFDNHNLGLTDFIANRQGDVPSGILIRPVQEMELFLSDFGIAPSFPIERRNATAGLEAFPAFGKAELARLRVHYAKDIEWFERRWPQYPPELV